MLLLLIIILKFRKEYFLHYQVIYLQLPYLFTRKINDLPNFLHHTVEVST